MEYVEQNLYHYVQSLDSYERHGLSAFHTWSIGQQIVSALDFLHRNGIAHRDLKPDNVLVEIGPNTIKAKVADFGLAWHAEQINIACTPAVKMSGLSSSSTRSSSSGVNIRWGPPEFFSESESDEVEKKDPAFRTLSFEDYKRGDVYCFGLVLAYTLTGQKPFDHLTTSTLEWWREQPLSPSYSFLSKLRGPLPDVIVTCIQDCPTNRSSIENLTDTFLLDASPYENAADEAEFFSCGILRKTNIFIADTCTTNIEAGCYQTGILPTGYDHRDLVCELDRSDFPYKFFPDTWGIEDDQKYLEFYQNFKEKAMKGEIENNPKAALKELIILREGDDEEQRLQLRFKETEYCHQQAMRFVWRSLTEEERNLTVPCKTEVSDCFSNTFGLQICVLTYEGDGNPQKFMFPQRANRTGIPTPGAYTGGAVEGASVLDYTPDGKSYDLVQTAVRGLKEELSIELSIEEREVICITTLYLAFDNYEWGMCGFLDLSDPRLSENNRVSAAVLQDRFVSGPKDKFEHSKVKFVPFALEDMVQFLYENHENVASYAKAAVVKVLQAYFGSKRVEQAFGQKFPKT
ncbi:hypothetical protein FSP39_004162 [Pinctada imbricata]|uniref:Protein kinase domain-containing protein n=1 Tax=Pinctada imbricata TaxID=66713 RepID=A0AA88YBA5_PINIB|nr:hypothetical protein FSP39_004162 [Pinctada imbricata]